MPKYPPPLRKKGIKSKFAYGTYLRNFPLTRFTFLSFVLFVPAGLRGFFCFYLYLSVSVCGCFPRIPNS